MKGISPIIAVVLLLMITISMVAFAYIWFTRITTGALNQSQSQQEAVQQQAGKRIVIDGINGNLITLRNIGTYSVSKSEISVFVNGVATTITSGCDKLDPQKVETCMLAISCPTGGRVRVVSPGMSDEYTC